MSDDQTSDIRYSRKQEGGGAWGAGVLWFLCFVPNDGLCPQSGLVQRGVCKRFSRLTGPVGQRILTFDSGFAAEGCGIA